MDEYIERACSARNICSYEGCFGGASVGGIAGGGWVGGEAIGSIFNNFSETKNENGMDST